MNDQCDEAIHRKSARLEGMEEEQRPGTSDEVMTTAMTTTTSPELQRTQSQEHLLDAPSPSPTVHSQPSANLGQEPGNFSLQLPPRNPDVVTDSEVRPLLGSSEKQDETKCEDEAATNEEKRTTSAAGDREVLSISSDDDDSLDVKWRSYVEVVVTSSDAENSDGTLATTELQEPTPVQTKEAMEHFPDLLSGAQQSTTARIGLATPQLAESVQTAGATSHSEQSPNSLPLNLLPTNNAVHPTVSGLPITSNTQFEVVTSPLTYQLPGPQKCDSVRPMGSVSITGATSFSTRYPYRNYRYILPLSCNPTNKSVSEPVPVLPTPSTQVTGVGTPYSLHFSDSKQTISAAKIAGVGPERTMVVGSAPTDQTLYHEYHATHFLSQGNPDPSTVTTRTNTPVRPTVTLLTTSTAQTTTSTSSIKLLLLSKLSDSSASTAAQQAPKTTENTVVSYVTHKAPVTLSVPKVRDGAAMKWDETLAVGDTKASNIREFELIKRRSNLLASLISDANTSRASEQITELRTPAPEQMAESSSDHRSVSQKRALTVGTEGFGSTMADRVESMPVMGTSNHPAPSTHKRYLHSLSVTTPPTNPSPKLTAVASPTSSIQTTTPTSLVGMSIPSNLPDFYASARGQRRGSKAKRSRIRKESALTGSSTTQWPSLPLSGIASFNSNWENLLLKHQVSQPPSVTDVSQLIKQSAEVQPLDLSSTSRRQQRQPPLPLSPSGFPPRRTLPPPFSSPFDTQRRMLHTETRSFPISQYTTIRPAPGFAAGPLVLRQLDSVYGSTINTVPGFAVAPHISGANIAGTPSSGIGIQPDGANPGVTPAATRRNIQREVSPTASPSTVSADPQSVSPAPDPTVTDRSSET